MGLGDPKAGTSQTGSGDFRLVRTAQLWAVDPTAAALSSPEMVPFQVLEPEGSAPRKEDGQRVWAAPRALR